VGKFGKDPRLFGLTYLRRGLGISNFDDFPARNHETQRGAQRGMHLRDLVRCRIRIKKGGGGGGADRVDDEIRYSIRGGAVCT
jgi:hypothetical protein